jgi:hypothetical protein
MLLPSPRSHSAFCHLERRLPESKDLREAMLLICCVILEAQPKNPGPRIHPSLSEDVPPAHGACVRNEASAGEVQRWRRQGSAKSAECE